MTSNSKIINHVFPIINTMVDEAVADLKEEKTPITCKKGCDHCCHLLVEISYEESEALVDWINKKGEKDKERIISKVLNSAKEAKSIFNRKKSRKKFLKPYSGEDSFDDEAYDEYFYEKKRPCPFLSNGMCEAYEVRPTPCRLHLVTSDPNLCSYDVEDDSDFEVPERVETLKEEVGGMLRATQSDGRWGQLSIMVEALLREHKLI